MKTFLALACVAALSARAGAQQLPDLAPYLMTDRAAEIALARSAAPHAITDSATVLVLARTGFVEAAHGSNGFVCAVFRSFDGDVHDPNFWSPRISAPLCFNPPAARTVLPAMLARAKWILGGTSPADADARVRQAYAAHEFPAPEAGAMSYMLSPRQYLVDGPAPHLIPHLMFFYDRSLPPSALGAGDMSAPIINASAGDPTFPVLTVYIPVPRWSDGTPLASAASH